MKTAISYIRWSSGLQDSGSSLARQTAAFNSFCQAHHLTPFHDNFLDKGKSGFKAEHRKGDFGKFLAMAEQGAFPPNSVLVVEALDRFSRELPLSVAATFQAITKLGIAIGVCQDNRIYFAEDLADMGSVVSLIVKMCSAHQFSAVLSTRVKSAKAVQRTRGNKTKEGKVSALCPRWLSVVDGEYKVNDFGEMLLKTIDLSIAGHGANTIKTMLNLEGKYWNNLASNFRRRSLVGDCVGRDGNVLEGAYLPLITMDKFRQLQASVDARSFDYKPKQGDAISNLFTGLIFSPEGFQYDRTGQKNRNGTRRRILSTRRKGMAQPTYDYVENLILENLLTITDEDLYPSQPDEAEANKRILDATIADKEAQISALEAEILDKGSIALSRLIVALEGQIEGLKGQREALATKQATQENHLAGLKVVVYDNTLDARTRAKRHIAAMVARIVMVVRSKTDIGFVATFKNGLVKHWNMPVVERIYLERAA
jgi:DNA invertase Pin-like site-specific DNA recombinase